MNSFIKFVTATAIAASATATLFTTTVHAQSPESRSLRVATADLNLSSAAGQERLAQRIHIAAKEVCESNVGNLDLKMRRAFNDCISTAKSQAMAQIKQSDGRPLALKATD
jgi:UrcA family protein